MFYDPKKKLFMPERFKPPSKQRGSIQMAAFAIPGLMGQKKIEHLATNTGTSTTNTASPSFSINFGAEGGGDRILLAFYSTHEFNTCTFTSVTYNGVTGNIWGSPVGLDGGEAGSCCWVYWTESQISGWTSGSKTFSASLSASQDSHLVTMMLFKNVDQDIFHDGDGRPCDWPYWVSGSNLGGLTAQTPPWTASFGRSGANTTYTFDDLEDYGLVLAGAVSEATSSYVSGDISDAGSNINWLSEVNPANTPGMAHRVGWDIVPDASEIYNAIYEYGAAATLDTVRKGNMVLPPLKDDTAALDTTVTSGRDVVYQETQTSETKHGGTNVTTTDFYAQGFDRGADYFTTIGDPGDQFGSIATHTYTDGSSTSREITACYWTEVGEEMFFSINGTSVPNTDETWIALEIDGVFYARAGTGYWPSIGGASHWAIGNVLTNPFAGANPDTFKVWCRTIT